ncbi:phosphoglycerate mutase-like protein [Exidia glandulosa HHB12029]|uniref:Phosphoglycerate mutase-like protein n=1 Tax=Exidia glandulosa HHB12029 TaxID=1314781 RepID=A0A165H2P7_EXIGL|nr:phosphoglycerate mutase-like protein [Exidia glandulosa HHB12029]
MFAPLLLLLAAHCVAAETVLGVVVFTRHGDRSSKLFNPTHLTTLGLNQVQQSGTFYHSTYIADGAPKQIFNISTPNPNPNQVAAFTPDEQTLYSTGYAFLQGLYPPRPQESTPELLTNGSTVQPPFGYNYLTLHGENADAPESIWLKGDVACPTYLNAAKTYPQSADFKALTASTQSFYQSFAPLLSGLFKDSDIGFSMAYSIFDYLNVGFVHNETIRANVTPDQLFQLRTLADAHEWALAFNESQPERSLPAQPFIGKVIAQLNQTITAPSSTKFSLLVGSYITFQAFFGVAGLQKLSGDWIGLPDYASTIAFEAVTNASVTDSLPSPDDVSIRFLFRNGSAPTAPLTPFPLLGTGNELMSWADFQSKIGGNQIVTASQWCTACHTNSTAQPFCPMAQQNVTTASFNATGMKPAVAGVVGAMVTLGVAALVILLAALLGLRLVRRGSTQPAVLPTTQAHQVPIMTKEVSHDGSSAARTML